ncbi:Nitrate reductase [NADH] 1 [Venturia inaequalis]|nr:Nitrate reductase [NADH] 1 [Venturia inaequalis]
MPAVVRLLIALQGAQFAFAAVWNSTHYSKPASPPSITASPSGPSGDCAANCEVYAHTTQWYWVPLDITTTLTAATVLYVVGKNGTTRTSTIYADLPEGYTQPPTNDKGTHIESLSWTDAGGKVGSTTIAFPTQFEAYPAGYTWDGTLSTVDKAGKSFCATASSSYVPFSPYATPTQDGIADSLLGEDGCLYSLAMESIGGTASKYINPNDGALKACSTPDFVAPASAVQSAQFLTVTSTSHEASTPTSTPLRTSSSSLTVTKPESQVKPTSQTSAVTSTCTSTNCDDDDVPPLKQIITCDKDHPGTTTMGYILAGATLAPGSTITFGSGLMAQTIVLRTKSSLTQLEVDGKTSVLPTGTPLKSKETGMTEGQTAPEGGRTGIGGGMITGSAAATPVPDVVIIGGAAVTSGTVVSIVGGKTVAAVPAVVVSGGTTLTQNGAVVVTGGKTVTDSSKSVFVVEGKTLSVGGSITVGSGPSTTVVALSTDQSGNSVLVVGSKTSTIAHATGTVSTSSMGVGDYINSGLGGMGLIISSTTGTGAKSTASATSAASGAGSSTGLIGLIGELGMGLLGCIIPFLL